MDALKTMRIARRRAVVILLCVLVVPGVALALSLSQPKQYSASSQLLFRDPGFDQKLFGSNAFQPGGDPTREAATNSTLVGLEAVAARTAHALNDGLTAGNVRGEVEVLAQGQANVIAIRATDRDPNRAARIANEYAMQFIAFRREADQSKIQGAEDLVQQDISALQRSGGNLSRGRSLRQRVEQLQVLKSLQTGNAELVQPALPPTSPSSPRPFRSAVIGGFLGVLLAIAAVFMLERFDRRLRDREEVAEVFGRPVIGVIPRSRALTRGGGDGTSTQLPSRDLESFLLLRANLRYFNLDHEINSVLVTSAAPGDGKSTIAKYLAIATALTEGRALLIEADLRHPVLRKAFGATPSHGLSNVLAGQMSLSESVASISLSRAENPSDNMQIDVLFAGPLPPNPTDLIESDRMRALIDEAAAEYDLVVVDTPPTSIVSDAIPLVRAVDGVIVVSRLGKSTRDSSKQLREQLNNLGAPVLGVVVNDAATDSGYYGGYGYGYAPLDADGANGDRPASRGLKQRLRSD